MASVSFEGTPRFEILRKLGEGGAGVVYEALDRENEARVALKTLRHIGDGDALLRLKNEFRALQDLEHPNLVSLGELFEHAGRWFFTMELLEGAVSFLQYVRPGDAAIPSEVTPPPAPRGGSPTAVPLWTRDARGTVTVRSPSFDEARLRDALVQLARGLGALHAARMVHRDIKPSNVLVGPTGRVTILDFGLVTDLSRRGERESEEDELLGTVSFMAPEQVVSGAVGPAADWYSVGVMAYLALTGCFPVPGKPSEVLTRKLVVEPLAPGRLVTAVPDDLDRLCVELLRIRPEDRPSSGKVLEALRASTGAHDTALTSSEPQFIGRASELHALEEALARASEGAPVTLIVEGDSGVGKTALTRRFVQSLAPDVVVFSGRCYERESVPYKAFDDVVDALSRYLATHDEDLDALPADIGLLALAFPVLRKVDVVAEATPPSDLPAEPQHLRARVFAAIRELFTALTRRHRLVVVIDDLQWADGDSLALLAEVTRTPGAPAFLLLATMRVAPDGDDGGRSQARITSALGGDVQTLTVRGLPDGEARQLVRALVSDATERHDVDSATIAKAAAGHPLFIDELVRHALAGSPSVTQGGAAGAPLDDALYRRIELLAAEPRALVELLSLAGGPLAQEVASSAAGIGFAEFTKLVAMLRATRLVKTSGARRASTVEPYHDRIRRAVLKNLSRAAKSACHRRLASALEGHAIDAETLSAHWHGAGDDEKAATYAARAADEAAAALAFDRAARLYFRALALAPSEPGTDLRTRLGDALANAGRGAEAAAAYLAAVPGAPPDRVLALKRRAADQLLRGGQLDEGLAVIASVLESIGVELARTPRGALFSLLYRRARLRLRGLGYRERAPSDVPADAALRIEIYWSVAAGLGITDIIRGADFQTRGMLLALDAGEPYLIARALAAEAGFSAANGGRARARTTMLLDAADATARRSGHPHALAMAAASRGLGAYLEGRWAEARERLDAATPLLRDHCINVAWELHATKHYACLALAYAGAFAELGRRVPSLLREAQERGNVFAGTSLRTALTNIAWLAADDPERAHDELVVGMKQWSREGFHLQHHWNLLSQGQIDLYRGDGRTAYRRTISVWPTLEQSLLLRVQVVRVEALHLRARCAIAAAQGLSRDAAAPLLAEAAACGKKIAGERMPWSDPIAALVAAAVAHARGDAASAARWLEESTCGFDAAKMAGFAAAARWRLAQLRGDAAASLAAEVAAWAQAESVSNPARMLTMFAPGFSTVDDSGAAKPPEARATNAGQPPSSAESS